MENVFTVTLPNGRTQKGLIFETEQAKMNLVLLTGMGEHSGRYEELAKYLNEKGINVYVLDAVAQGLNAEKVEDQEKWYEGAFDDNVTAANIKIEEVKKANNLPTCIMGHSMGSFMTQRYLQLFPNTVSKAILCGSDKMPRMKAFFGYMLASMLVNKGNFDKPNKILSASGTDAYSKAVKDAKTPKDWLSYNEENVQKYIADPYCGAPTTGGFWKEFLRGLKAITDGKEIKKISKDEKILIISGEEDPVGRFGKGPRELLWMYKKLGVTNAKLKMFDHMRHEIHNENGKEEVWYLISKFLLA